MDQATQNILYNNALLQQQEMEIRVEAANVLLSATRLELERQTILLARARKGE
jgi:hypothetical protein